MTHHARIFSTTEERKTFGPIEHHVMESFTLLSGKLPAGSVLGELLEATAVTPAAGNTGNGVVATAAPSTGTQRGVYRLVCIEPAAGGGLFALEQPDGLFGGRVAVGVESVSPLRVLISPGSSDFAAGDSFTISVTPHSDGLVRLAETASTDGSSVPCLILAYDTDASAAPVSCMAYTFGTFYAAGLTLGSGHSTDSVRRPLALRQIRLT